VSAEYRRTICHSCRAADEFEVNSHVFMVLKAKAGMKPRIAQPNLSYFPQLFGAWPPSLIDGS
jgi:hypothetical protein